MRGGRLALNLALAAIVAVLAWLALEDGEAPTQSPRLSDTEPGAVTRIRLERAGGAGVVVLERVDRRWRMSAPIAARADAFRVNALLGLLSARSHREFPAAGADLAQYGLAPPRAVIAFGDEAVDIGGTDPVAGLRYVRSRDRVQLIDDAWFPHLFADAPGYVDPRPLPEGAEPVEIRLPAATWRKVEGSWRRDPGAAAVSADAGTALADAWRRARAVAVSRRDPALTWSGRVELRLRDDATVLALDVAETADAVLFARADLDVQYRFLPRQGRSLLGLAD